MPSCPSCGAERLSGVASAPCPECGARVAPEFELDVRKRAAPKPSAPKVEVAEFKLELAVDPRSFNPSASEGPSKALAPDRPVQLAEPQRAQAAKAIASVGDLAFDARLLAEYGAAPRHWLLSPFYAWRVLKRRRDLKKALVGRREEAARAAHEAEDALVAFAERSRPVVEKQAEFSRALEELRGAEDVLRSRDRVLASEQDAQVARLASVDARLAKLEADVAHAQAEERAIAGGLASAQAGLARGESKLKRAESELRAAQQRETNEAHE